MQDGLEHAETLAVVMPWGITYMLGQKKSKLAQMGAASFGITEGTEEHRAYQTIDACEAFFRRMGIKTRLHEYGITEFDLDNLAAPVDEIGWKLGEHQNIDSRVVREILALRL